MDAHRWVISGLAGFVWLIVYSAAFGQTASSGMLTEGALQFEENCQPCHQEDAIGEPGLAPSLTNPELLSIASDKFFMSTIRDGREDAGMPPFDFLGRSAVRAIVAYLRSHTTLPNRAEEVNAQSDARGDPRLGKQWYTYICSNLPRGRRRRLSGGRHRHGDRPAGISRQGVRRFHPRDHQIWPRQHPHDGLPGPRRPCQPFRSGNRRHHRLSPQPRGLIP